MAKSISKQLEEKEIYFDREEFVVVDMGTGYIKAGFSGEDLPRVTIPTVLAKQTIEAEQAAAQGSGQEAKAKIINSVGKKAFEAQAKNTNADLDKFQMHYPIKNGIINFEEEWNTIEYMLEHIFTKELGLEVRCMNVLMTDCPFSTKADKMEITKLMLQELRVNSFALINTAVLSLFSTGKTCGLVAECGEGVTYTVPIFEGYALPHAMHKNHVAGSAITNTLLSELQQSYKHLTKEEHFDIVRQMKEQMCHVSMDYNTAYYSRDDVLNQEQRSYELPDQTTIVEVSHQKRLKAAEVIFKPDLLDEPNAEGGGFMNAKPQGIHQLAVDSIEQCDTDLRIQLYNNIVLAGGTTLMKGFTERFDAEIRSAADLAAKNADINVHANLNRRNAAWIGGSMLASMSTFSSITLSYSDYQEKGEAEQKYEILKNSVY